MDLDLAQLRRTQKWKTPRKYAPPSLADEMIEVFNKQIRKRHIRFGVLSEKWAELVPHALQEHAYLATFTKGQLTVYVDSSSHLYELRQILLAGLSDQMLLACRGSGLTKIALKRGKVEMK